MADIVSVYFGHVRSTKNKERYDEFQNSKSGDYRAVGAFYVDKQVFGEGTPPKRLVVTITVEKE